MEKEQETIAQKQKEEAEKESNAIRQIDWHSFIVVETIDFSNDESKDLPAPLPLEDLLSMVTITEKEKEIWGDNMETVEAMDGQIEEIVVNQESESSEAQEKQDEIPTGNIATIANTPVQHQQTNATKPNVESPIIPQTPLKVVKGYQPKSATSKVQATQMCPKCFQQIPVDEFAEHMRIELMDPKHREIQRMNLERVKDTSLARPEDIVQSLDSFAKNRGDIFGDIEAEVKSLERTSKPEEKKDTLEKVIWDGHTSSIQGTARAAMIGISLEQQIAAIHASKGLITTSDKPAVGPNMPQTQAPLQQLPKNIPIPPSYQQPQNMPPNFPPNIMNMNMHPHQNDPRSFQHNMPPPFGFAPPPNMNMPPPHMMYNLPPHGPPNQRMGQPNVSMMPPGFIEPPQPFNPNPNAQFNPRNINTNTNNTPQNHPPPPPEEEPSKRARTEEVALIPEAEFLKSLPSGPISLVVSVPQGATKEEQKFNFHGQTFTFIVNPTDKIEVVKEKIKEQLDMPPNKQKLRTNQIPFLKEDNTLAFYNIRNGTTIIVSAKERGGKK